MCPQVPTQLTLERQPADGQWWRVHKALVTLDDIEVCEVPLQAWNVIDPAERIAWPIGVAMDKVFHPQIVEQSLSLGIFHVVGDDGVWFDASEIEWNEGEASYYGNGKPIIQGVFGVHHNNEFTTRFENAIDLALRFLDVGNVMQHTVGKHDVETVIGERHGKGGTLSHFSVREVAKCKPGFDAVDSFCCQVQPIVDATRSCNLLCICTLSYADFEDGLAFEIDGLQAVNDVAFLAVTHGVIAFEKPADVGLKLLGDESLAARMGLPEITNVSFVHWCFLPSKMSLPGPGLIKCKELTKHTLNSIKYMYAILNCINL